MTRSGLDLLSFNLCPVIHLMSNHAFPPYPLGPCRRKPERTTCQSRMMIKGPRVRMRKTTLLGLLTWRHTAFTNNNLRNNWKKINHEFGVGSECGTCLRYCPRSPLKDPKEVVGRKQFRSPLHLKKVQNRKLKRFELRILVMQPHGNKSFPRF